ncbi:MAG: hypothetical protein COU51_03280 [Parcubacteria group bacterium CG10_big_fil_rev_8_21_14_0_10_36_14]|nr:MAG: hypothetical protein COU51_03280 [Parcubacteria group bacterium CG10_big_fil_rev_8_21_14_0_10_36_14]
MKIDSSSLYRDIIKRAFLVTWRNRFLWILGFFTTFLGLGSLYEITVKNSINNIEIFSSFANKITSISLSGIIISKNLDKINIGNAILTIFFLIFATALIAFLIWLAVISFSGLIKSAQKLDQNKKKLSLRVVLKEGKQHFWQILGINILGKVLITCLLAFTGWTLSFIIIDHSIGRAFFYFFVALLFIAISLLITFLIVYASCFSILKEKSFFSSIKHSWDLFKKNWIVSIEASVILFAVNFILKLTLTASIVLLSIPFMILLLLFYSAASTISGISTVIIAIWILISIVLMVLVGSFYSAFQIVAWTFIFDRINKGGVLSKLHRIFG